MKRSYLMMALAMVLIVFSNWKPAEKHNHIKNSFHARLEDKVNDKLKIVWQPVWEKGSYETSGAWIPLQPVMKDQQDKTLDGRFDMPNTTRYLYVETKGRNMEFSIRTVIGQGHENMTSGNHFTGMMLTRGLTASTGKVQSYKNGLIAKLSDEWICVYWTVCNWVGSGPGGCPQYVTTTSPRSGIPYAFPCSYPGDANCWYQMYSSHVEQYCE